MAARKTIKFAENILNQKPVNEIQNNKIEESEEPTTPLAPKISRTSITSRDSIKDLSRRSTRLTQMFGGFKNKKRRSSIITRPIERYLPTYQLESKNPFNPLVVKDLLKRMVNEEMDRFVRISFANEFTTRKQMRELCGDIHNHIRAKDYDRYRIIVQSTLLEKKYQDYYQNIAVCWDTEKDNTIHYIYERSNFVLIVAVFGIYYD
ncbi:hypothetical protein PVAND_004583 [Polypedilum vanderplanki]|uniref:Dynein light chain n=1 Tax=Polypedilum vanderplanki TaxID=319348 RepID=A0A9J6BYJ8_POLVA|nr:hypothetical protein PVAND_004583 [Polypedilum vanderplanki]